MTNNKIDKLNIKLNKKNIKEQKRERRLRELEEKHWYKTLVEFIPTLNKFSAPITLFLSLIIEIIIESISRHSLYSGFKFMVDNPLGFFYNSFIIFMPFLFAYFFKRRFFVRTIIAVLWLIIGIINGVVLSNRVTPFNAQDFKVLGDATTLINNYLKPKELTIIVIVSVLVIGGLVFLWKSAPIYKYKPKYVYPIIGIAVSVVVFFGFTSIALSNRAISNYFGNIAFAYEDYGLPYCFFSSVFNTGIDKPANYNQKTMDEIAQNSKIDENINDSSNPNIIFVQLESFMDPYEVSFIETNKDPIPNFRSLMHNYSSGYFKVPSIGAGTSNTEFECLTGMSMRYFGPGEYPYKTVLKTNTCESAASVLGNLGYKTHAIHNNGGNFYSRADVFNNMGFDTYTSKEEMNVLSQTYNGWATDDILLEHISDCLDYTEDPDFVYTITVQSHGKYPSEKVLINPDIQVKAKGKSESKNNSWEYYINEIHEVDDFIGNLIDMVNKRDEKTAIVFYGDHLPTMNLETSEVSSRYLYNTQYVIYDNFGLEKSDENVSSYQIMSNLLDRIGIHSGTMFNYHANRRKTSGYQEDLELVEYDLLYGSKYIYDNETTPVIKPHITFGIYKPVVKEISYLYDGYIIIRGERFNQNSHVFVNGVEYESNFWNNNKLVISDKDLLLKDGDKIVVSQVGSSSRIFTSSDEFIYTASNPNTNNE